jgi:hypothetical protein
MPQRDPLREQLITWLWAAYLLLLPWHRVWHLPRLGTALQPPEIAFLALAALAVGSGRRGPMGRFGLTDAGAMAWAFATGLALVWSGHWSSVSERETVGTLYLVSVYALVRFTATPARVDRFAEWFGYSAAIAALSGVIGSLSATAGVPTRLALSSATPVAYLGQFARAQALTAGPQMLASILLLAIPLYLGARLDRRWRRIDTAILLVLIAGLAATLSKSALALPAVLAVVWACRPTRAARADRRMRVAASMLTAGAALALSIGTMFMVVRASAVPFVTAAQFAAGAPVRQFNWRADPWVLMRTTYYFNHLASARAIEETFPVGVGPRSQPAFSAALAAKGRYPTSIWADGLTAPHSTYLGVPAELGLAGVAAFLLLMAGVAAGIRRFRTQPLVRSWAFAAYAGASVGFCLEALSTDLMNCRHYWWLAAIVASRARLVSPDGHAREPGLVE